MNCLYTTSGVLFVMDIDKLVARIQEGTADPEEVAESFDKLPLEIREKLDLSTDRIRGGEITTPAGIILPRDLGGIVEHVAVKIFNPNGLKKLTLERT